MDDLKSMPNIGAKLEDQLKTVGVESPQELIDLGSREAWLRIKAKDPSACLMRLSALEGAIRGVRWHDLPPDVKEELRSFYHANK
ncbi:MAG TPA: TfoX/Sxy family protein [Clostridiales bacterium]|jgi:DNA transformation protein|nr:TfoX/Sxy family protein [Clostridiales bacterium]